MNNAIIIVIVAIVAVCIWVLANSNYDEVTSIRDQKNLQFSLQDCKRLFVGGERTECFEKSFNSFGTEQQKQQWDSGYYTP